MIFLQILAGFAFLVAGGELLVRNSVAAAGRLGVSPLLIGLTLVGFGTSTPELVTSLNAALSGAPGIAVGNVVGSNIANVLLILGLTSAISPIVSPASGFRRDATALVVSALAASVFILWGEIGRAAGTAMLLALAFYLLRSYQAETVLPDSPSPTTLQTLEEGADLRAKPNLPIWVLVLLSLLGILVTIVGADLMVEGAVSLARVAGMSESLIGLTIVAVGTSLPEMVTSVMAAIRREPGIALGNIIGSNIFNLFGILGLTALVSPIQVPADIGPMDVWALLLATASLIWFGLGGWNIRRRDGVAMLGVYTAYVAAASLAGTA